ncbi:unnamed protein product [Clonostachys solani]|uniref:Pro-apoptotic serine protease NMA111 n=1 Tax=Clonostachys solani TaxID=160281 RepID=A0A9N9YZM4_9HYPO|nr:unnamed protein product [Clonostachys solani]
MMVNGAEVTPPETAPASPPAEQEARRPLLPPGARKIVFGRTSSESSSSEDDSDLTFDRGHGRDADWQKTISKVADSVVSIHYTRPLSFDTDTTHTSQATGFIVDAERGYVLTNRHIVGSGPFWGHIIFNNREEADVVPLYRDPIHDFGILRFDPKTVKHMKLAALDLHPELAKVGAEIKVIGNDGGETLGILSGFISRTDRNAPSYSGSYRDFNTAYYQSNAAACGGSSGSPVVNINGHVLALQAGSRSDGASTDYFLPLHEPLRALGELQAGKIPTRGDIQTCFRLQTFDECRRLGLTADWESHVREQFPKQTSMLFVRDALPEGPADGKLKAGDILLKINGTLVVDFLVLDTTLNDNVGKVVKFHVLRAGRDVQEEIVVDDLEKMAPTRFLSVAGGCFHDLSHLMAHRYVIRCKGVYVSETGLIDLSGRNGWIMERVANKLTPDLDTFVSVMKEIPDRARVPIAYRDLGDLNRLRHKVITVNRHWAAKMKMVTRNDKTGIWDFETIADALPPQPPVPCTASFPQLEYAPNDFIADMARTWVQVTSILPFYVDAVVGHRSIGMGLVIDACQGLVLVPRSLVPHIMCDLEIVVAQSIMIEGKVLFLHPSYNYSVVQYDAKLVDAPVLSAVFSNEKITQGHSTYFVGHSESGKMVYSSTMVTRRHLSSLHPTKSPRYRPVNVDFIGVESRLSKSSTSGVLLSDKGEVQAVWLTWDMDTGFYAYGLGADLITPVIDLIRGGQIPSLRVIPAEFEVLNMFQARVYGVTSEWIDRVEASTGPHQLFSAKRVFGDGDPRIEEADILLTMNGELITQSGQLDMTHWHDEIDVEVVRNGEFMSFRLNTLAADDLETSHFVSFCGMMVQKPQLAVRQVIRRVPSEIFVSTKYYGSPSCFYGMQTANFITHINDEEVPSLEKILEVVNAIPDNTYFQIRAVSWHDIPFVITMKKNEHYYPTWEWLKDPAVPGGWMRRTYEKGKVSKGEGAGGIVV